MTAAPWPIAALFAASGMAFGAWIPFLPLVSARFELREREMGLALGVVALAAAPSMLAAGALMERAGPRRMAALAGVLLVPALALPLHVPAFVALLVVVAILGAAYGVLDVTMNAAAAAHERRSGQVVMSAMHGCFSLGVFIGAAMAAALLWLDVAAPLAMTVCAMAVATTLAVANPRLPAAAAVGAEREPAVALPGAILLLGIAAALVMALESGVENWSAVWLTSRGVTEWQAALTIAVYAGSATLARFSGDRLVQRWGRVRVLAASGALATAALLVAISGVPPWLSLAAFAAAGAGTGNLVPILFGAAAGIAGAASAAAVSRVAALGYTGLLISPPAMGWLAEWIELGPALRSSAWLAAAGVLIALAALRTPAAPRPS